MASLGGTHGPLARAGLQLRLLRDEDLDDLAEDADDLAVVWDRSTCDMADEAVWLILLC